MADSPAKADGGTERRPAGYKSWKKKYRKMRIVFDNEMHECEELHKQEAKAAATVKRLAIENDRLLDLLLEVNNSPQIPPERRIDVSLRPPSDESGPCLPIDREREMHKEIDKEMAMKKLEQLLSDIPHSTYGSAKESNSSFLADLSAPDGESHPAHFLSADDIDDYIYLVDAGIDLEPPMPTMAPLAHPIAHAPSNPQTKNPTSVTNWLRKHAPKIFLQDGETHGDGDDEGAGVGAGPGSGHTSARKPRSSAKGERGGGKAGGKSKKAGAAARISAAAERGDGDASMDDDGDFGATPVTARSSKRKRDDDTGYKPRGSSSRPTKKKRKSDVEATPTARKSKKEAAAASKDD
ncbi:IEC3 subunit of the Ino80 complex, chromatin re-modelling domain-containing protein [Trichoderma ceciliae]